MKILNIDSSILNVIQNCAKKAEYSYIYNLQPHEREESLEKGDLMHKMLEVYYSLKMDEAPGRNVGTWKELIDEANIYPLGDPVQRGIDAGMYFASKMQTPSEVSEEVVDQFQAYCEHYKWDEWHPLKVESVGNTVIYEEPELFKIVYNYKMDLIAEKGRIMAPFDHKTGSKRHEPTSLSNQFIGYCYASNSDNIVVNKIGFQKSLKPAERFQRFILTVSKARIREWLNNTIYWAMQYMKYQEDNYYPMNLTSCDKYSGCIFRRICESDPDSREWKLDRDFTTVEKWDVARSLERSGV